MKKISSVVVVLAVLLSLGWGQVGHKIINKNTTQAFPASMSRFSAWSAPLASHASDADDRKGEDPTEGPKHYLNIDSYPEFIQTKKINQYLDSNIAIHGSTFVTDCGILPWAILTTMDSLTNCFQRKDYTNAQLFAADLGHYVGDAHMPLHITTNYDGQLSNQKGIHSRYESQMIGKNESSLIIAPTKSEYVADVRAYVFQFIYTNFSYVDSVLKADSLSKKTTGSTSSKQYYDQLWAKTKGFTVQILQNASERLASLIYTAWKNAGSPDAVTFIEQFGIEQPGSPMLLEAYPNPCNSSMSLKYTIPLVSQSANVVLRVFATNGELVREEQLGVQGAGVHIFRFQSGNLASGVYIAKVSAGSVTATRKLVFLK